MTRKTALDRDWTDRISLTHDLDFDLWPWPLIPASYGHDLLKHKSSRSMVSQFRRQSGKKRTDRRMESIALAPSLKWSVSTDTYRWPTSGGEGVTENKEILLPAWFLKISIDCWFIYSKPILILHNYTPTALVLYICTHIYTYIGLSCTTLWSKKNGDSTFDIITLENTLNFYNFCIAVSQKKHFTHSWKIYTPHLNNVLTLPCKNETIHFPLIMHS